MSPVRQLVLTGDAVSSVELTQDPGADYGEVFTRGWVVDLILDLVGYTPEKDLGAQVLVEPSCGTGAFLGPVVERLITSAQEYDRDLRSLGPAIRAFDLLDANAERARKAVMGLLMTNGMNEAGAEELADEWVTTGDFLLQDHELGSADYVVGNPPYIRLENVSRQMMEAYRNRCATMRGRADIYVGFIEHGLDLLKRDGGLAFICADRWMRNQYGADLRKLITSGFAVDTIISMHEVDAFEDDVSAYPAIVVLRKQPQGKAVVVEASGTFHEPEAVRLKSWIRRGRQRSVANRGFEATRVDSWFSGGDLWPAASPADLAILADLEKRFPSLQDESTGTIVGIGVATGCDEVYLTDDASIVEPDRLLPLVQPSDIRSGKVEWSGSYLVNPWSAEGLVDLDRFPRLNSYFVEHQSRLRKRFVARKRPSQWYRTIDRVNAGLASRPKILLPDMKAAAHPVLDDGKFYPHHNLYVVTSEAWDPEVLGGLLLSDFTNLFVGAYCVKMRGGCYRFQAQYLRRIRVPKLAALDEATKRAMKAAFADRDVERATAIAAKLYGVMPPSLGQEQTS